MLGTTSLYYSDNTTAIIRLHKQSKRRESLIVVIVNQCSTINMINQTANADGSAIATILWNVVTSLGENKVI